MTDFKELMAEYLDSPLSADQQEDIRYRLLNLVEGVAYSLFRASIRGDESATTQLELLVKDAAFFGVSITQLIRRRIKHIDWMIAHGY